MMVTIVVSACPPSLRGDLTKWLLEVDVGVYVGRITARVRDMLWNRITRSIGSGHVVMISSARNEQHFEIQTYNSSYQPVDFDGLTLMMKNSEQ